MNTSVIRRMASVASVTGIFAVLSLFLLATGDIAQAGGSISGYGKVILEACEESNILIKGHPDTSLETNQVDAPDHCIHIYPDPQVYGYHHFYYTLPKEARDASGYYEGHEGQLSVLDSLSNGTRIYFHFSVTGSDLQSEELLISNVVEIKIQAIEEKEETATAPIDVPPAGFEDEVITAFDVYNNPFPDTDINTLEGRAAAELYRRAVVGGFSDGEFKGYREVNRAEAAKFLLLARHNTVPEATGNGGFWDVLSDQWYTKFVVKAAKLGIINGHPDGTFRPGDSVNTAEFLKMISKTFGLKENLPYTYEDVEEGVWFARFAGIAQVYNLFPNRTTNLFPAQKLTRHEVAVAIYQYLSNRNDVGLAIYYPPSDSPASDYSQPVLGKDDALVTIVEWVDLECPFCARFHNETLPLIKENYIDSGIAKLVMYDFPLAFHANAKEAANAAHCARSQGGDKAYFDFVTSIFSRQEAMGYDFYKMTANELALDLPKFTECVKNETYFADIEASYAYGQEKGISGTPGFAINGKPLMGAQPYEVFKQLIEESY